MYGESEVNILRNLPVDTHFAIDYYDRKIYWTQEGDFFSEIRSYKLDTDDIPDDEVIRSIYIKIISCLNVEKDMYVSKNDRITNGYNYPPPPSTPPARGMRHSKQF